MGDRVPKVGTRQGSERGSGWGGEEYGGLKGGKVSYRVHGTVYACWLVRLQGLRSDCVSSR